MDEFLISEVNLFERIDSSIDERIIRIREIIKQYERLNVPLKLIEKAKCGLVSCFFKSHNLQLLWGYFDTKSFYKTWHLYEVEEDGTHDRGIVWPEKVYPVIKNSSWSIARIKNFEHHIPLEILKKLPQHASEKGWIFFSPEGRNCILTCPLIGGGIPKQKKCKLRGLMEYLKAFFVTHRFRFHQCQGRFLLYYLNGKKKLSILNDRSTLTK